MNVYPFVEAEQAGQRNVGKACALLEVSRAAYYKWSRHAPSARARADEVLGQRIERIHHDSRGTYGAPAPPTTSGPGTRRRPAPARMRCSGSGSSASTMTPAAPTGRPRRLLQVVQARAVGPRPRG